MIEINCMCIENIAAEFMSKVEKGEIEIYSEFSLQHEFGIYLRRLMPDYKVQFERNIKYFQIKNKNLLKKEIDISVFKNEEYPLYAIELKYPRNKRHPETMFDFCKDISFCEELVGRKFKKAYALVVVDDPLFYETKNELNGIYQYFRNSQQISGEIKKPTKAKTNKGIEKVNIKGKYLVQWNRVDKTNMRWYIIKIDSLTNDTLSQSC